MTDSSEAARRRFFVVGMSYVICLAFVVGMSLNLLDRSAGPHLSWPFFWAQFYTIFVLVISLWLAAGPEDIAVRILCSLAIFASLVLGSGIMEVTLSTLWLTMFLLPWIPTAVILVAQSFRWRLVLVAKGRPPKKSSTQESSTQESSTQESSTQESSTNEIPTSGSSGYQSPGLVVMESANPQSPEIRFGIWHVLVVTTAVAMGLSLGRWVAPHTEGLRQFLEAWVRELLACWPIALIHTGLAVGNLWLLSRRILSPTLSAKAVWAGVALSAAGWLATQVPLLWTAYDIVPRYAARDILKELASKIFANAIALTILLVVMLGLLRWFGYRLATKELSPSRSSRCPAEHSLTSKESAEVRPKAIGKRSR